MNKLPTEWADVGIEVKGGWRGNVKTHCPQCRDQRKNRTDKSLSVNIDEKIWNCHYCRWSGKLFDKDFMSQREKKEYTMPALPPDGLSEKSLTYFKGRGISEHVIKRFKITDGMEWMPQPNKEINCIRFPYYRNEKLVNIKYRSGRKDFKMVKDAELILFNLDAITGVDECMITEGEFDCMSAYEAGYFQVCSVPNGASLGNAKLEYLDNCYDAFAGKKKIIIATDGDRAGLALREELSRRLGKHRCYFIVYPDGCKDFNEVLLRHGKGDEQIEQGKREIRHLIETAQPFPIEGVYRVRDMQEELGELYETGIPRGDQIGYGEFDNLFSFKRGEFTVVTGIPGSGKSAFLDQCLIRLSSRYGWKHAICSFENQPIKIHVSKLASCFCGQAFGKNTMHPEKWQLAQSFIDDHFWFYGTEEIEVSVDAILDKAKELIMRHGVDSLVIDPWNYVELTLEKGETETLFISRVLTKFIKFARAYGVHLFLVAHPVKMKKIGSGKYEVPNLYSIAGSAHFFAKPDNGITVYVDAETKEVSVYIQKVRFQPSTGKPGQAMFTYEVGVGRYAEPDTIYEDELSMYLARINKDAGNAVVQAELGDGIWYDVEKGPF